MNRALAVSAALGCSSPRSLNLKVGFLRLGDINLPPSTARCTASSIYSDEAYSRLSFQVIGSRLRSGCAAGKTVATAIDLMHRSGE